MFRLLLALLLVSSAALISYAGLTKSGSPAWDGDGGKRYPESGVAGPAWTLPAGVPWDADSVWPIRGYEQGFIGSFNLNVEATYTSDEYDSMAVRTIWQAPLTRLITPNGRAHYDEIVTRNPDIRFHGYTRWFHGDPNVTGGAGGVGHLTRAVEGDLFYPYRIHKDNTTASAIMWFSGSDTVWISSPHLKPNAWQGPTVPYAGWDLNYEFTMAFADTMKRYFADFMNTRPINAIMVDHLGSKFQTSYTSTGDMDQDGTAEWDAGGWNDLDQLAVYGKGAAHMAALLRHDIPNFHVILNGNWLSTQFDDSPYDVIEDFYGFDGASYERFGQTLYTLNDLKIMEDLTNAIDRLAKYPWTYLEGRTDFTVSTTNTRTTGISITSLNLARVASLIVGCYYMWREAGGGAGQTFVGDAEPGYFVAGKQLGDIVTKTDATYTWYLRQYSRGWARMKFVTATGVLDSCEWDAN